MVGRPIYICMNVIEGKKIRNTRTTAEKYTEVEVPGRNLKNLKVTGNTRVSRVPAAVKSKI